MNEWERLYRQAERYKKMYPPGTSLAGAADLPMPEGPCFLRSLGSLPLKDQSIFYLRTYPDSYRMTAAGHLRRSSARFLNWGTMSHGRCLTARISEFPNPERECILSDILEKDAPAKYFLSQKQMEKLLCRYTPDGKEIGSIPREDSR